MIQQMDAHRDFPLLSGIHKYLIDENMQSQQTITTHTICIFMTDIDRSGESDRNSLGERLLVNLAMDQHDHDATPITMRTATLFVRNSHLFLRATGCFHRGIATKHPMETPA